MLLWLILSIATVLCLAAIAVLVSMSRAERRARTAFYRSLGYSEDAIAEMKGAKNGVAGQLAQLRQVSDGSGAPQPTPRAAKSASDGGN